MIKSYSYNTLGDYEMIILIGMKLYKATIVYVEDQSNIHIRGQNVSFYGWNQINSMELQQLMPHLTQNNTV